MKALKIILIIIAVSVILLVAGYAYFGGFKTITFKVEEQGGEIVVYETMTGDYSQSPEVMDKVYYALLNDEKIETTKGIGIFYDNPEAVEKSKLRSEIGCIVEGLDSLTIAQLSEKYKVKILPTSNYIFTEFPYKGIPSYIVGMMKVYPAFRKYFEQHGVSDAPIMEIYDMGNKKIVYRMEQ
jgi:hypothetical protein